MLVVGLVLAASCSSTPPSEQSPPVPDEVTGTITGVERGDAGEIAAFTVSGNGGPSYEISIDPARDYGFDLEHLVEHQTTGDPVIVTTEDRDGTAYALQIIDA